MNIEKKELSYLAEAIKTLDPDAKFAIRGDDLDEINWETTPIAKSEIDAEIIRLKAEWIAKAYSRNRAAAYDSVGNQLDMLMKDMKNNTTTHQESCEAVKAKFPK